MNELIKRGKLPAVLILCMFYHFQTEVGWSLTPCSLLVNESQLSPQRLQNSTKNGTKLGKLGIISKHRHEHFK